MDPIMFFVGLAWLYGIAFFFDCLFKSCLHYPYDAFQKNTGLTVKFLRLNWHTTAFNRAVLRWGSSSRGCIRGFLIKSYTVGLLVALSLLPIGIILLFLAIFSADGGAANGSNAVTSSKTATQLESALNSQSTVKIEILLPGVNLPLEEVGFYIVTLLFSSVVHELGHALAAVLEDVPVTGFGFHLYFCIPIAYTELSSDHLNTLKWFRKLRILCAGIWHNFIFAAFCYLLLSSLGFMTSPFYTLNKNVIVTEVAEKSPLRTTTSDRGIAVGNIITHINDCHVFNEDTWYLCLLNALRTKPSYCVSSDFIRLNDESVHISHHDVDGMLQCCDNKNEKLCCFEYIEDLSNDAPVEIPQNVCLDVRRTIEDAYDLCVAGNCERGFCLRPLLRNTTTILNIKRHSADNTSLRNIVYIGHPADVTRTVRISPFVPKQEFVAPYWADAYALFLRYNVVFSLGLALINSIPCFGFDGHHIINTIINIFLAKRVVERPKRDVIAMIVTSIGTLLFGIAVLKVVWLSAKRYFF